MDFKEALNRLHRSRTQKVFGGVCGGVAEVFDLPAWLVRTVFVFVALGLGTGVLLYIVLWLLMPEAAD